MSDLLFENLKQRCRMFKRDLVSFDDVCGYMQALIDVGVIDEHDVSYIIDCLLSDDDKKCDWMYY